MKTKSTVLTAEERRALILAVHHGQHPSNSQIAERLGISVSKVKTILHGACAKLGAHSRNEAIFIASMKRGEISLGEYYTVDELAEKIFCSLSPDMLRRIAQLVRRGAKHGYCPGEGEQLVCMGERRCKLLTRRERDVLILSGRGLTNKEIAGRLCMCSGSVRTFLNRVCTKLGVCKRTDALVLALKQREITIGEIVSPDELVQGLSTLGAEAIEKMAQLLEQKLGQEHTSALAGSTTAFLPPYSK